MVWPVLAQTSLVTSSICEASSRVGVMTRASGLPGLAIFLLSAMRWSAGSVKAQVLPVENGGDGCGLDGGWRGEAEGIHPGEDLLV